MKSWLPVLVKALDDAPVLVLAAAHNLAQAVVLDRQGHILAGSLTSPDLTALAAGGARRLSPGQCAQENGQMAHLILECLAPDEKTKNFWTTALESQAGAWASWLLTIPRVEGEHVRLSRHLLSAYGPWTTPQLPEELRDKWSLLPLKPGLGRLFIMGDDALAMETAALAARTGFTVTWISAADQQGPELEEARRLADFELKTTISWNHISPEYLVDVGLADGAKILVTAADHETFMETVREARPAALLLSGEAEGDSTAGLSFKPVTTTQQALGLITEMLR